MKELAGLTHPIVILIEYEFSIFSTTNDDMFMYLVDYHVLFSPNCQADVRKNSEKSKPLQPYKVYFQVLKT